MAFSAGGIVARPDRRRQRVIAEGRMEAIDNERAPYFLISHARGDDDCYVEDFFGDLRRAVGAAVPGRRGAIGVLASEGSADSDAWAPDVAAALATCRVFIPLCSPRLFLNRAAGRHWWIARERARRYTHEAGVPSPALMPLLWAPTPEAEGITLDLSEIDPDRPDRPLRQYLRLRHLRDRYREVVSSIARRVVDTGGRHPLPPYRPMPVPSDIPNAFSGADRVPVTVRSGRSTVHFVVAAGSREQMAEIREVVDFYGVRAEDWTPFRPALDHPLADHASAVAADRLFSSDVVDLAQLPARIEQAGHDNEILVLLVDPWSPRLSEHRRLLAGVDHADPGSTAVLVAVSASDPETVDNGVELGVAVRQALAGYAGRADAMFRPDVRTPEDFDAELATVLEAGRNQVLKAARPRYPSAPVVERPILQGP
jgi:FxsC-like protein